jgi:quinol monooxygenase YgiN
MKNENTCLHRFSIVRLIIVIVMITAIGQAALAQDKKMVVRVARLQIDSAQLQAYNTALKEHAETAIRVEPGVITLYAVAEKDKPTHITVFEIYASEDAYQAHRLAPHFLKYKNVTKDMVKSLQLMEVDPIVLATKPKL